MAFFRCPGCQVKLKSRPEQAGRQFRCPQCGSVFCVPLADGSGTDPNAALSLADSAVVPPSPVMTTAVEPVGLPPWEPGTLLLDDFVVEQHIATGGMGDVYRVRSRSTGEPFAVKRIRPKLLRNPNYRQAFLRELRTWVELTDHPHLTACRFFRSVEDQVLIFAEYVAGRSLDLWLREGRCATLEKVLDVAIQAAWGLEAAHQQGVIHQDVKPANILMQHDLLLEESQHAKVTDFGLAQAKAMVEEEGAEEPPPEGKPAAKRATGAGTPGYCSPEQLAGEPVSPRADIWGWAVSVFEMLLGKRTWLWGVEVGKVFERTLEAMENGERPFRVTPSPSLIALLRRCFHRNPADRLVVDAGSGQRHGRDLRQGSRPALSPPVSRRDPQGRGQRLRAANQAWRRLERSGLLAREGARARRPGGQFHSVAAGTAAWLPPREGNR